jgi:hypothetical protein
VIPVTEPTTNAKVRKRYEDGKRLTDGATLNTAVDQPNNGADTVVAADTDVHAVSPDGTNTADLSNVAESGRQVTVIHTSGGANTPAVAFDGADFVGTGPANLDDAGDTATILNQDSTTSGWVVIATGSA